MMALRDAASRGGAACNEGESCHYHGANGALRKRGRLRASDWVVPPMDRGAVELETRRLTEQRVGMGAGHTTAD